MPGWRALLVLGSGTFGSMSRPRRTEPPPDLTLGGGDGILAPVIRENCGVRTVWFANQAGAPTRADLKRKAVF
jgi:hypothetical protein